MQVAFLLKSMEDVWDCAKVSFLLAGSAGLSYCLLFLEFVEACTALVAYEELKGAC